MVDSQEIFRPHYQCPARLPIFFRGKEALLFVNKK